MYDITHEFGGALPALYSPGSRVTSRLDLRDNRKVITDYKNLGIIHILTDLVVSSRYLLDVLRETPSRVMPRKASSCELGCPWGRSPCGLPWVSGVIPPIASPRAPYTRCATPFCACPSRCEQSRAVKLMIRPL